MHPPDRRGGTGRRESEDFRIRGADLGAVRHPGAEEFQAEPAALPQHHPVAYPERGAVRVRRLPGGGSEAADGGLRCGRRGGHLFLSGRHGAGGAGAAVRQPGDGGGRIQERRPGAGHGVWPGRSDLLVLLSRPVRGEDEAGD